MTPTAIFAGIDIAKADFVVACRPNETSWTAPNTAAGITATVGRVRALAPSLIVLEATGGYETPVVAVLAAAGLPVVVANPRQVRDFAKGHGPTRQDRSPGCAAPRAVCGTGASHTSPVAGCGPPAARRAHDTRAAIARHAHGRGQSA